MEPASETYRYIVRSAEVRGGNPVVEGTRIGVHDVISLLQNGETVDTLTVTCFPQLTRSQVYECLLYYEDHRGKLTCWLRGKWRRRLGVKFLLDHDVPEDLSYLLEQLGHQVTVLRKALPRDASDATVLQLAHDSGCVLLTCNRDDFLELATKHPHSGVVVVIRRRTRAAERAALFRLLERAGEAGLKNNINFA